MAGGSISNLSQSYPVNLIIRGVNPPKVCLLARMVALIASLNLNSTEWHWLLKLVAQVGALYIQLECVALK